MAEGGDGDGGGGQHEMNIPWLRSVCVCTLSIGCRQQPLYGFVIFFLSVLCDHARAGVSHHTPSHAGCAMLISLIGAAAAAPSLTEGGNGSYSLSDSAATLSTPSVST